MRNFRSEGLLQWSRMEWTAPKTPIISALQLYRPYVLEIYREPFSKGVFEDVHWIAASAPRTTASLNMSTSFSVFSL